MQRTGCIFIDFHGTICHDLFFQTLPETESIQASTYLFTKNNEMVLDWMRGKYTYIEICKNISTGTGIPTDTLITAFVEQTARMYIAPNILEYVEQLQKKYITVLITDNMDTLTLFTVPKLNLNRYFDSIVNSFDVKRLKQENNGQSYAEIIKNFGVTGPIYAVDDSCGPCTVIESFGGVGFHVTAERTAQYFLKKLQTERLNY